MWYWVGEDGWATDAGILDEPLHFKYAIAVHWSATQFQGVGGDMGLGRSMEERSFAFVVVLGAIFICATLLSNLTTALIDLATDRKQKYWQMEATAAYMHMHNISTEISVHVKKYIRHYSATSALDAFRSEEALLLILPATLKRLLIYEARRPIIDGHPVFRSMRLEKTRFFERICCDLLKVRMNATDASIFNYGEVCNRMMFVQSGELLYNRYSMCLMVLGQKAAISETTRFKLSAEEEHVKVHINARARVPTTATKCSAGVFRLLPSSSICEPVLWSYWLHCGDCTATIGGGILELDFEALIMRYPSIAEWGREHSIQFVASINQSVPSDLFDTDFCLSSRLRCATTEFDDGTSSTTSSTQGPMWKSTSSTQGPMNATSSTQSAMPVSPVGSG